MLAPARGLQLDPELAPHLAVKLLTKAGMRLTSTLDARFQRIATTSLARQLHGLAGRARDGAVIVVDNATGDVLAYVGGAGTASTAPAVDAAEDRKSTSLNSS